MAEMPGRPQSLVDRAYEALKQKICDGTWAGGEARLEREAADEIGVSRTPVREALIRLEEERLVEVRPRRGFVVLPISADDMADIYEILTALESHAAAKLASQPDTSNVLSRLEASVDAMDAALAENDLEAWARADLEFHRALVEEAGNQRLAEIVRTVSDQVHRARLATLRMRPKPIRSNSDHRAVLQAIRQGDADTAFVRHKVHREKSREVLVALLNDSGAI